MDTRPSPCPPFPLRAQATRSDIQAAVNGRGWPLIRCDMGCPRTENGVSLDHLSRTRKLHMSHLRAAPNSHPPPPVFDLLRAPCPPSITPRPLVLSQYQRADKCEDDCVALCGGDGNGGGSLRSATPASIARSRKTAAARGAPDCRAPPAPSRLDVAGDKVLQVMETCWRGRAHPRRRPRTPAAERGQVGLAFEKNLVWAV